MERQYEEQVGQEWQVKWIVLSLNQGVGTFFAMIPMRCRRTVHKEDHKRRVGIIFVENQNFPAA